MQNLEIVTGVFAGFRRVGKLSGLDTVWGFGGLVVFDPHCAGTGSITLRISLDHHGDMGNKKSGGRGCHVMRMDGQCNANP